MVRSWNKWRTNCGSEFNVPVKTIALDLTADPAPQFLFDQLQREGVVIDALVNNAGYGKFGEFAEVALEESLGQIQLNITALTHLTKLFLGPMMERHAGKIMNVASTAGFQPGPLMAVYYATKAYVISFSEALANELKNKGITVTCFCPGATGYRVPETCGDGEFTLVQKTWRHARGKPWHATGLSRHDERQDAGDFRIAELARGRVGAGCPTQNGDCGFAMGCGEGGVG